MLECAHCHTLNPDAETACLACGSPMGGPERTGVSGVGRDRCPAGHAVDPEWKSCPYCERETGAQPAGSGRATRLDAAAASGGAPAAAAKTRLDPGAAPRRSPTRLAGEPQPPPPLAEGPARTRLEEPARSGRATVLSAESAPTAPRAGEPPPAPLPAPAPASATSTRRLVGVLAAPLLGAGGTVFALRTGRNVLGSGPGSDVLLDADGEVSREHAVILHRNDAFHLADRLSTNGTWVNGREVPANGTVALADRDRIRLGATELLFLRVDAHARPETD